MVLFLDINLTPPQEQHDGGTILDLNFSPQEEYGQEAHIPAGTPRTLYFHHITVNMHI